MNILIAKMIIQDYVDRNDLPLYEGDAQANFAYLYDSATTNEEYDVIQSLDLVDYLNMKHILKND